MNWLFLWTALSFALTVFCLWLTIHSAVMNPGLRPHLVDTPGRMAIFSILRFLTTGFVVYGLWRTVGWFAGIASFFVIDYIRHKMLEHYTLAAAIDLKNFLLREMSGMTPPPDEALVAEGALQEIHDRIKG